MLTAIVTLLDFALSLFVYVLFAAVVFSLLTSFGVLDTRNRLVWAVGDFLHRATDPVLRPIRNVLPNLGGIDISPIIVFALIQFLVRPLLASVAYGIRTGNWQPLFL